MTHRDMAGNNVVWQPQVVDEMLSYYKEKIQSEGKQFIFKETHHQECATQINEKFHTAFTQRQVYHKFHKLKAQWKLILEAKNLSGANFDDVNKIILYDETEVVRMKNVSTISNLCQTMLVSCLLFTELTFTLSLCCPEQRQKGKIYQCAYCLVWWDGVHISG